MPCNTDDLMVQCDGRTNCDQLVRNYDESFKHSDDSPSQYPPGVCRPKV